MSRFETRPNTWVLTPRPVGMQVSATAQNYSFHSFIYMNIFVYVFFRFHFFVYIKSIVFETFDRETKKAATLWRQHHWRHRAFEMLARGPRSNRNAWWEIRRWFMVCVLRGWSMVWKPDFLLGKLISVSRTWDFVWPKWYRDHPHSPPQ